MYHLFIIICAMFAILMVINLAMKDEKRNQKLQDLESQVHGLNYELSQIHADHNKSMAQLLASAEALKETVKSGQDIAHQDRKMINDNVRPIVGITTGILNQMAACNGHAKELTRTTNDLHKLLQHISTVSGLGLPGMTEEQIEELRISFLSMNHRSFLEVTKRMGENDAEPAAGEPARAEEKPDCAAPNSEMAIPSNETQCQQE